MLSIIENNRTGMSRYLQTRYLSHGHVIQLCSPSPVRVYGLVKTRRVTTVRPFTRRSPLSNLLPAAAIAWGALGPEMFGPHGTYHIVPIALAIGLFLPLPFYIAVRLSDHSYPFVLPKCLFHNSIDCGRRSGSTT